jgi:hypothetical protein
VNFGERKKLWRMLNGLGEEEVRSGFASGRLGYPFQVKQAIAQEWIRRKHQRPLEAIDLSDRVIIRKKAAGRQETQKRRRMRKRGEWSLQ